jgi:hypothetical protein
MDDGIVVFWGSLQGPVNPWRRGWVLWKRRDDLPSDTASHRRRPNPFCKFVYLKGHKQFKAAEVLATRCSHILASPHKPRRQSPFRGRLQVLYVPAYNTQSILFFTVPYHFNRTGIAQLVRAGYNVPPPRVPVTSFRPLEIKRARREDDQSLPFPDIPSYNLRLQLKPTDRTTTCQPQTANASTLILRSVKGS